MTKDWTGFLAASLRLVDLHDSARSPGAVASAPREERTGLRDGLWLDLAVQLLSYLDECDLESNEGWNPLGPFFKDARGRHTGLSDDDVQLVVHYLATPTEFHFIKDGHLPDGGPGESAGSDQPDPSLRASLQLASSKDTALIERRALRGQTDVCRLTGRGRLAISLARASHNWLYAHHDADKLITALHYGEFQDVPPQCAALGQSIRAFAHEITRVLEQPGRQQASAHFMERGSHYLDSIRRVQSAVRKAREQLATADTRERFNQWLERREAARGERHQGHARDLDLGALRRSLDELMQAVERLSRRFSAFLQQVTDTQREVVGAIAFDRIALAFAMEPPPAATVDQLTNSLGPRLPQLCFAAPADMQGILRAEVDRHQATQPRVFGAQADGVRLPSLMELFVEHHRDAILAALQDGPLRLGTALERGWATVGADCRLTELVGVYSAPAWLATGACIRLAIIPGQLDAAIEGDAWLAGDDIEMQWISEQEASRGS